MKKIFKKIFKKDLIHNDDAALSYFIVFVLITFFLLTLFAVFTPMVINMNVRFFEVGESLINDTQEYIDNIQDISIKNEINDALNGAKDSTSDQVTILANFYQYAWIFIIVVVTFVIYIIARSHVEVGIR